MITPASIKARYPEFNDTPDARIQIFIDDAVLMLNEARAGIYYDLLLSLLTTHELALANKSELGIDKSSGVVSSMSEGDTSIGFSSISTNSNDDFYYQQTTYGLKYLSFSVYLGGGGTII